MLGNLVYLVVMVSSSWGNVTIRRYVIIRFIGSVSSLFCSLLRGLLCLSFAVVEGCNSFIW